MGSEALSRVIRTNRLVYPPCEMALTMELAERKEVEMASPMIPSNGKDTTSVISMRLRIRAATAIIAR